MVPLLLRKAAGEYVRLSDLEKDKGQECQLKGFILSQPSADSSLCGGSLLEGTRAKPPLKGEVPAKRAEGFVPHPARPRRLCQPP